MHHLNVMMQEQGLLTLVKCQVFLFFFATKKIIDGWPRPMLVGLRFFNGTCHQLEICMTLDMTDMTLGFFNFIGC